MPSQSAPQRPAPTVPRARPAAGPPLPPVPPRGGGAARFSIERRWWVLLGWVLLVAAAVLLIGRGTTTTDPVDELVGDSRAAAAALEGADFGRPQQETLVLTAQHAMDPATLERLHAEAVDAYRGAPHVTGVGEGTLSADGRTYAVPLLLDTPVGESAQEDVAGALERTADLAAAHPELEVGQVGPGSIDREVGEQVTAELHRAELLSIPLTLLVLLLAFRSFVSALVPVVLGLVSVVVALGLTALVSGVRPVAPEAASLTLLIGLAVGVDYALFVLRRARAARAEGASVRDGILLAARTSGRAVVVSGATVVVSMAGMLVAGGLYTSLALGAVLVVAVAVLASATLLPALMAVLGDRVEALRLPRLRRGARGADPERSAWGRVAGVAARRPVVALLGGGALVVGLAVPAFGMQTALPGAEALPEHFESVQALDRLTAAFPDSGATVDVVVTSTAAGADRAVAALERADAEARAGAAGLGLRFAEGTPPSLRSAVDGRVHVLALPLAGAPGGEEAAEAVAEVRERLVPRLRGELPAGATVAVGGVAEGTDLSAWMSERLPWVAAFVLVLTFAVVLLSFGSPALALATLVLNAGSCLAAFGIVTVVFGGEWAEGLLGFTSTGAVVSWLPVLMLVVLFGLSMDYHVLVVARVREEFAAGRTAREAVAAGVARTAGVVTSAAVVMVAVFAVFGTMSDLGMKQLGVGLAAAVLLDATVVRGLLLPAALALLGRSAHTGPRWVPALHG
ncbi:RND superfamily putative drug exporter [Kineococcus xinjiangensis]|uniref:RND superfamily putative drug exporter n=1 Tax=Kineococcus xinjiangensis TaxID=512762 RepID=A0A2S6IFZ6_9ACTN|nr:MMPL family transporter [Kineococcus xinjiangensis]PPK93117.1 RND superfamily putative drug exporter [Kineococcus xinjiangensis]